VILVTGASGFVGAAVVRKLLAVGEDVRVLLRPGSSRKTLTGLDVDIGIGDLMAPETLKTPLRGCKGLFHVAADYRLWTRHPEKMFKANVDGTVHIVKSAMEANVERIVYTSSVATLGIVPGGVADENTPVSFADMIGPYKQSKFLAEQKILELIHDEKAPVVIVNPSTPIGPFDVKPTPTGRIVVETASKSMPAFVDTGLNVVHVDDVAAGQWLAYRHGKIGERYILGGDDLELRDLLKMIADAAGVKAPNVCLPRGLLYPLAFSVETWARFMKKDDPFITLDGLRMSRKKMFFSSTKAMRELGYQPGPASQAITDAVDWFAKEGYLR